MDETGVFNNIPASRFELDEQGHTAYADYRLDGEVLHLDYVFAPAPLRGTGAAGRLMTGIVEYARDQGLMLNPVCGYAASWLRRHPETEDVVA